MPKKLFMFLLTIFSLGLLKTPVAKADEVQLPSGTPYSQIGQKIEDFVKEHQKTTAGMETAVFDQDSTIYRGNFGYLDKEKGIKADENSIFEWGSITKLTVWISVMQLWEEGQIDLEADIQTYLPEGFFKNLRYDKPITMLDLMNHQAGFSESTHSFDEERGRTFEEILTHNQPEQSYEPGTVTSYSNFTTGVASYIVERISGKKFSDYVHEHIFQPLAMDQTSILPDFSDNAYVREKRKDAQSYDSEGKSIGSALFELELYPVGQATGTAADLQKFGQALLKKDKLFKRSETWETLYSASSTYPGSDMPLNMHGFWTQEYGTTVVGHGGNTSGYSAFIHLDLKNGIGMLILTNQLYERVYNNDMPALVFGPKKKTEAATFEKFQSGYYRPARYFATGPLSISRTLLYTQHVEKSEDNPLLNQNYAVFGDQGGREKVTLAYGDTLKVDDGEVHKDYAMLLVAAVGLVVSLLTFLLRGGLDLFRLIFKKSQSKTPRKLRIWTYVTSLTVVAVGVNFALFLLVVMQSDLSFLASWRYMLFAGLGLLLAACSLYPLVTKARKDFTKGRLALTILTSLSALAIVVNILYWSLYQWWAV